MEALSFVSIGFAPGLFWLWRIYLRNHNRPDHKGLVARTFLLGVAVALPVLIAGMLVQGPGASRHASMTVEEAAFKAFVVAGLVEEIGKFLIVRWTMFRSPYFDEPMRGLIYASAVALGFASIENVGYMIGHEPSVIVLRAFTATLGHVFFSSPWGYALGAARRRPEDRRTGLIVVGLAMSVAGHGLYDFFLFCNMGVEGFATLAAAGAIFWGLLARAARVSPYRGHVAQALAPCPACGLPGPASARFCTSCGQARPAASAQHCGKCLGSLIQGASYCNHCGARVI
jgi:RsiW-degrading membrane proteinase PrsW (M82 family)